MPSTKSITTAVGCIFFLAILVGDRISRFKWLSIEQSQHDIRMVGERDAWNHTKEKHNYTMDSLPMAVMQHDHLQATKTSGIESHVDSHPSDKIQHNQSHALTTSGSGSGRNNGTQLSTVKFIPFPHNTLGSGTDMECQWETKVVSNPNAYDFIQLSAFKEGICIPKSLNETIHIFSSTEAKKCLSFKRVIITGDSYMKQLFIGLADILLGKKLKNDEQITDSTMRAQFVETANYWLAKRQQNDASFPTAKYSCEQHCYGMDSSFSKKCSKCINSYTLKDGNTVAVVGAGVHIMSRLGKDVNATAREIGEFLNLAKRTVFVSMPSYELQKVPEPYKEISSVRNSLYDALIPNLAPSNHDHPFLDVYQFTKSCTFHNCSYDGGHRSRYVNRWKAQLLLNTLCEVVQEITT